MAVHYVQNNNDWLSTLGKLAALGGEFIPGMEWLTPLGMGMNGVNSALKGDAMGAVASTISGMKDAGWLKGVNDTTATDIAKNPFYDQATKNWQSFYNRGYNSWLL